MSEVLEKVKFRLRGRDVHWDVHWGASEKESLYYVRIRGLDVHIDYVTEARNGQEAYQKVLQYLVETETSYRPRTLEWWKDHDFAVTQVSYLEKVEEEKKPES